MIKILAIALESVGIAAIIAGISIEVIMDAPVGYIAVTIGAGVIATGSLLSAKVMKRH